MPCLCVSLGHSAVVEAFRETLCKKCVGHLQVANKIKELMGEERLGNMTFVSFISHFVD